MKISKPMVGLKEKDPCGNMSPIKNVTLKATPIQLNFNPSLKFKQAFSEKEFLGALRFYEAHSQTPAIQRLCTDLEQGLALIILAQRRQFRAF